MPVNVLYQPSQVHGMHASDVAVVSMLHWGAEVAEAPSLQCVDAGIRTYVCTHILGGYVLGGQEQMSLTHLRSMHVRVCTWDDCCCVLPTSDTGLIMSEKNCTR